MEGTSPIEILRQKGYSEDKISLLKEHAEVYKSFKLHELVKENRGYIDSVI